MDLVFLWQLVLLRIMKSSLAQGRVPNTLCDKPFCGLLTQADMSGMAKPAPLFSGKYTMHSVNARLLSHQGEMARLVSATRLKDSEMLWLTTDIEAQMPFQIH